jgi:hypothetical protein
MIGLSCEQEGIAVYWIGVDSVKLDLKTTNDVSPIRLACDPAATDSGNRIRPEELPRGRQ